MCEFYAHRANFMQFCPNWLFSLVVNLFFYTVKLSSDPPSTHPSLSGCLENIRVLLHLKIPLPPVNTCLQLLSLPLLKKWDRNLQSVSHSNIQIKIMFGTILDSGFILTLCCYTSVRPIQLYAFAFSPRVRFATAICNMY